MKGFLACALALAERIAKTQLSAPLSLSISYDEEIGCVGIQQMMPELKHLIGRPRVVIVGEPTSMQIAIGHKGKTALNVTCHGQAGHSALAPNFVNAVHVAADFVQQMRGVQAKLADGLLDDSYSVPFSTVHIGKIAGGTALNVVPSDAQIAMEFRHLAQTPAQDILRSIEGIAGQISDAYPSVAPIDIAVVNTYPGLDVDPSNPVINWVGKFIGSAQTIKVPFGTEAGFFSELGLDTVVIGPGDMASDGHKPDEGLSKTELAACDAMMDKIAIALKV
jgi:acetylornithine deacetylase